MFSRAKPALCCMGIRSRKTAYAVKLLVFGHYSHFKGQNILASGCLYRRVRCASLYHIYQPHYDVSSTLNETIAFSLFGVFCFVTKYFHNDCIFFFLDQNSQTVAHGPTVGYKSVFSYYNEPIGCIVDSSPCSRWQVSLNNF